MSPSPTTVSGTLTRWSRILILCCNHHKKKRETKEERWELERRFKGKQNDQMKPNGKPNYNGKQHGEVEADLMCNRDGLSLLTSREIDEHNHHLNGSLPYDIPEDLREFLQEVEGLSFEEAILQQVNKYYDLVTSFYEYGWGESFHFAPRWKGESLKESIKRHEHFLALQLGLKPGQKVLDVGCGIGGPLREIARFSSTSVMGINNNEYQITRGKALNQVAGVDRTCDFIKADFMKMPFPENNFDAVYAIEATCHAPDAVGCYKEIYRVLKPGQSFAAYEWCMTDAFDPNNQDHQKIKAEIEIGDGLPDIRSTRQCLAALKEAGFEQDLAKDSPLPWYLPLDTSHFSLSSFRLTAAGRFITKNMVIALEYDLREFLQEVEGLSFEEAILQQASVYQSYKESVRNRVVTTHDDHMSESSSLADDDDDDGESSSHEDVISQEAMDEAIARSLQDEFDDFFIIESSDRASDLTESSMAPPSAQT
ncbi:hypothetical protein L2E82_48683 [Cichorium intybus]|uniref:Uncharacterized protein n=1 Tax=Cichorium intybus TaxID=13427 RepID=A0ACB8YZN5_CICIN|nr:hypothetical protein L2E82_48683 [Cichorium intybus]